MMTKLKYKYLISDEEGNVYGLHKLSLSEIEASEAGYILIADLETFKVHQKNGDVEKWIDIPMWG